jgi:hypothetical protein
MRLFFINNDGAGFADEIEVADGTTIGQLFLDRIRDRAASDYLIRVDRQVVPSNHVLTPGCRVSITPVKIDGAVHPSGT